VELVSSARHAALNSRRKVLVFLEQLKSEGASSARSRLDLEDEFGTNINDDGEDDMASDVQEGAQSTVGSLVQRNGVVRPPQTTFASAHTDTMLHATALQHVEPGPDDEPGPHYESYGSSFGNFGPMPPESAFGEVCFVWHSILLCATTGADDIVVAYSCSWCPAPHIRCFAVREGPDFPPRIPCF